MLQKLADALDTDVRTLLGSTVEAPDEPDKIAEQLAKINEQLIVKNRRWHTFWKVLGISALAIVLLSVLLAVTGAIAFSSVTTGLTSVVVQ